MRTLPSVLLVGLGLGGLLLTSCNTPQQAYIPPPDDAGDAAWARAVLPIVLGRKPKSLAEVEGVAQLAAKYGRETALDALMRTDEFVEYWQQVLLDDLQVDRQGYQATSNLRTCDVAPLALPDTATRRALASSLVRHIRSEPVNSDWCWTTRASTDPDPVLVSTSEDSQGIFSAREAASDDREVYGEAADAAVAADEAEAAAAVDRGGAGDAIGELPLGGDGGSWAMRHAAGTSPAWDDELPAPADETCADEGVAEADREILYLAEASAEESASLDADYEAALVGAAGDPETQARLTADYAERQRGIRGVRTCADFNVADVLVASVEADDLSAAFLVGLAQMPTTTYDRKQIATGTYRFLRGYLGRDPECLACHSSSASTTDPRPGNGDWDRTHPVERWDKDPNLVGGVGVELDPEMGAFTWMDTNGDVMDGRHDLALAGHPMLASSVSGYFRDSSIGTAAVPGIRPWGILQSCVQTSNAAAMVTNGLVVTPVAGGASGALAGTKSKDSVGPLDLIALLRTGIDHLPSLSGGPLSTYPTVYKDDVYSSAVATQTLQGFGCDGCHSLVVGGGPKGDAPSLADSPSSMSREYIARVVRAGSPSGLMAPVTLTDAEARKAADAVRSLSTGNVRYAQAEPAANLAQLLAQNVVDDVMREVTGSRLTLAHGFPRNAEQAATLSYLTDVLLQSGWSLRALLSTILLEDGFNRQAPAAGSQDPYTAPALLYPWSETTPAGCDGLAPSGPECNGVGDSVQRYSATNMVGSWAGALSVPRPNAFAVAADPVSADIQVELGRYGSADARGDATVTYPNLLRADERFYDCNPGTSSDWIDQFSAYADAKGWTVLDAFTAVKVRMHSTNVVDAPEITLLGTYYEAVTHVTTDITTTPYKAANVRVLREYCGALLLAPQFQLHGLPNQAPTTGLDVPVFTAGEPKDAQEWCNSYAAVEGLGC